MSLMSANVQALNFTNPISSEPVRDASEFEIFSTGETGAAHEMAHRMLDQDRFVDGYRLLGAWLKGRSGTGSEWVHLQFHMAIFELVVGDWESAHTRFLNQVLPTASTSEDALTDAPQLLWRLALAAPRPVKLSWGPLRQTAIRRMRRPSPPYVQLHNLLALAGAGDFESMNRYISSQKSFECSASTHIVYEMALALSAFVTRQNRYAADILARVVPRIGEIGGSKAQNQLFEQIALTARQHMDGSRVPALFVDAG
jgi:hypothetical protein